MHPLRHPRNAIFLGLIFVILAIAYWGLSYVSNLYAVDYAGVTMLLVLGIAGSIMAYVLIAGSPND